ncbi:MAG: hypothetical protein LBN08_07505 [Lactobacillales bacterium]|jgi:hypothetical protein|nr:hypothetical protein [Lactobacillales bacterium]
MIAVMKEIKLKYLLLCALLGVFVGVINPMVCHIQWPIANLLPFFSEIMTFFTFFIIVGCVLIVKAPNRASAAFGTFAFFVLYIIAYYPTEMVVSGYDHLNGMMWTWGAIALLTLPGAAFVSFYNSENKVLSVFAGAAPLVGMFLQLVLYVGVLIKNPHYEVYNSARGRIMDVAPGPFIIINRIICVLIALGFIVWWTRQLPKGLKGRLLTYACIPLVGAVMGGLYILVWHII